MTKKKSKEPEEFDYAEFCIKFTKLCMKLSLKFCMLFYLLIKHIYKRIGTFTIKAIDMGGKDTKEIIKQVNVVIDQRRVVFPK